MKYRQSEKGRERQRARSLACYHRRGKELRRQRRAHDASVPEPEEAPADEDEPAQFTSDSSPADSGGLPEIPCDSDQFDGAHPSDCLTHKRVGEGESRQATMESSPADSAAQAPGSRSDEEVVDAQKPSDKSRRAFMSVLTTVAQVQAALLDPRQSGSDDVVVWGRCSRCGRVGRVVLFDGELRARARAP